MSEQVVLLLGAGSKRKRLICVDEKWDWTGQTVVTLDIEARHDPDIVHDLEVFPWPFADDSADEIHMYQVLEHLGRQGDVVSFFSHFYECWRILKPGGHLCATVPMWNAEWAFGDPGHRRVITFGSLSFLSQKEYHEQVGKTPMADYRSIWKGDFDYVGSQELDQTFAFSMRAVKPARVF